MWQTRTDDPHGYYKGVISGIQKERDKAISDLRHAEDDFERDLMYELQRYDKLKWANKALREENAKMGKIHESEMLERKKHHEAAWKHETERHDREIARKDEEIKALNSTIETLKAALRRVVAVVKDICLSAAALVYAEDSSYTPWHKKVVDALINVGAKAVRSEGFEQTAEKIERQYGIADSVERELEIMEQARGQAAAVGTDKIKAISPFFGGDSLYFFQLIKP